MAGSKHFDNVTALHLKRVEGKAMIFNLDTVSVCFKKV